MGRGWAVSGDASQHCCETGLVVHSQAFRHCTGISAADRIGRTCRKYRLAPSTYELLPHSALHARTVAGFARDQHSGRQRQGRRQMTYELAPPEPAGLIATLSSLGYSLPAAVAD